MNPVVRNKIFDIVLTLAGLDKQENLNDLMMEVMEKERDMDGAEESAMAVDLD